MRGRIKDLVGESGSSMIDSIAGSTPAPHLRSFLPHRQRLPLRRAGHEDRGTPRGSRRRLCTSTTFRGKRRVQGGRLKSPHTIEIPSFRQRQDSESLTGAVPKRCPGRQGQRRLDRLCAYGDPTHQLPRWPAFNPTDGPPWCSNNQSKVGERSIREHGWPCSAHEPDVNHRGVGF